MTSIPGHSLHRLLPPYRSSNLRERGHSFHLPDYDTLFLNFEVSCYAYNKANLWLVNQIAEYIVLHFIERSLY